MAYASVRTYVYVCVNICMYVFHNCMCISACICICVCIYMLVCVSYIDESPSQKAYRYIVCMIQSMSLYNITNVTKRGGWQISSASVVLILHSFIGWGRHPYEVHVVLI